MVRLSIGIEHVDDIIADIEWHCLLPHLKDKEMGRKFALIYLVILTLVMAGALAYGFIVGDFWKDGGELMDNPWGIVSLFDVYVDSSSLSVGLLTGKVVREWY